MKNQSKAGSACSLAILLVVLLPGLAGAQDFDGVYAAAEVGMGIIRSAGSTIVGPVDDVEYSGLIGGTLGFRSPVGENGRVVLGLEGAVGMYTQGPDARLGAFGIGGLRVGARGLAYLRLGYVTLEGVQTGVSEGVDGPAAGGGFGFYIRDSIGLRIDYRYIDFGSVDVPDNTMGFDGHEMTAAIVFNF
jgi:opacity protein-like surface antigen